MLTTIRDPQNLRLYFKTYENQTVRMIDLKDFDLDAKVVKQLSTNGERVRGGNSSW